MKKKGCFPRITTSYAIVFCLSTSVLFLGLVFISSETLGRTLFVGGTGPGNYTTVQNAVDNADDGDTILIHSGTYEEHIIVSKRITLKGESKNSTIIDTRLEEHNVYVTSDWVSISELTITGSKRRPQGGGVVLHDVSHCRVSDVIVTNRTAGIILHNAHHNILERNLVHNNLRNLHLRDSDNNIIGDSEFLNGTDGISLFDSHGNTLWNNSIHGNSEGIALVFSQSNIILENDVIGNRGNGITLSVSENNTFSDNVVLQNSVGARLSGSANNTFIRNSYVSNSEGIYLEVSSSNTFSHNTLERNGFSVWGDLEQWTTHQIGTSNTVNGKPVYYWKNVIGGTISQAAGQVILANCAGVTVKNQMLINATVGIQLGYSSGNTIADSNFQFNERQGVYLHKSDDNRILNSVFSENWMSVRFWSSDGNTVAGNDISRSKHGIYLGFSDGNTIVYNNIYENNNGIHMHSSSGNLAYHNNLVNNVHSALDGASNLWDSGYPSGGNFWSEFTGPDIKSGPNQDMPGSDGIRDTSVRILGWYSLLPDYDGDWFPLVSPVGPPPWLPLTPEGLQSETGDRRVILTWQPPLYDGRSKILGYRIYREDPSGSWSLLAEVRDNRMFTDEEVENGEEYRYSVTALNTVGEGSKSKTISATPMNRPPRCTISFPLHSTRMSNTVTVSGTSFDPDGSVQNVMIWFDDGPLLEVENSTVWDCEWDTTRMSNGNHTIHVVCYDGSDYSNITSVLVEVYNPPSGDWGWFWPLILLGILLTFVPLVVRYVVIRVLRK